MEVVKSTLEQQAEKQDKVDEARAFTQKRIAFVKRQLAGKLTYTEFKTLGRHEQIGYVRSFGFPKTAGEIRGITKAKATRRTRSKIARKSRARNR